MKYSIYPKPFIFISPLPPDEVMKRLHELIVTSYPYFGKNGKPFKGRIDSYSFEMQRITERMRNGGLSMEKRTPLPPKIKGTVGKDGSGSIIQLTNERHKAFIFVLAFAAVSLLICLIVAIFTSTSIPLFFMIPSVTIALSLNSASNDIEDEQDSLMLFLTAKKCLISDHSNGVPVS